MFYFHVENGTIEDDVSLEEVEAIEEELQLSPIEVEE